ncbi:MAG: alkaline phytoceramidase [Nitrosomonas sp.]|nr:alkaline phytoceramidase [Nitrosomonas sp.]
MCSVLVILAAAIWPPIAQPHDYHGFADQRFMLGIPNFMNVISNLAILYSGVAGLIFLRRISNSGDARYSQTFKTPSESWPYLVFFISIVTTALGSAYYHWQPDNATLLWDRLPIAIGIMALLAAMLVERVDVKLGLKLLPVLVLLGAASVIYWYWSEQQGAGNLNFYIVIQFYSLLLIVLLSLILPSGYTYDNAFLKAIGLYALAKVAEMLDQQLFSLGQIVSGHTLKHLIAALAIWWIVRMLQKRSWTVEDKSIQSGQNY